MKSSAVSPYRVCSCGQKVGGILPILLLLLGVAQAQTPPDAPSNLQGTVNSNSVNLTWVDNSTNEDMFKIDRATSSDFTQNLLAFTASANVTAMPIHGLNPATTYWFRVRAFRWNGGESANAGPLNLTTNSVVQDPLPAPWVFTDVGSPGSAGSTTYQCTHPDTTIPRCQYTVSGGGADIWGTSDQFGYLYQTLYGSGEMIARVDSLTNTNSSAKAGVMIRETTAANAKNVALVITPTSGASLQWRAATGGGCNYSSASGITAPRWVKLTRSGNTFNGYYSADGRTWTQVGSAVTVTMNTTVSTGLCVTAHDNGQLCVGKLSEVSLARGANSVPFGGGIGGYGWYTGETFVDKMKQCDVYKMSGNTALDAAVDANGWPTEDFSTYAWITNDDDLGKVFKLSATHVNQNPTIDAYCQLVTNKVYNSSAKTVTADVVVTASGRHVALKMTGTGGGAKNIKLILPGYSTTTSQTFTTPLLQMWRRAGAIRFMDLTSTNNNKIRSWADRSHVSDARYTISFNGSGKGLPWELAVKLCNDLQRDMWINVPCLADNTYITNLANLIKYGSDGVNPYTSSQASPVYPPLDANLNVYVEHSNETWNGSFSAGQQCVDEAKTYRTAPYSTAGYQPELDDPGTLDDYSLGIRWHIKRIVDISNLFKQVFGASAINARIRPIWAIQRAGDIGGRGAQSLDWVQRQFSAVPSTFLYGMALTGYHGPAESYFFYGLEARSNVTKQEILDQLQAGANNDNSDALGVSNATLAAYYGLRILGYEGGLSLKDDIRRFTSQSVAALHDALNDSSLAAIMSTALTKWYESGGGQFEYFNLSAGSDGTYSVTDNVERQNTPRLKGLDTVLAAAPPAVNIGFSTLPGELNGAADVWGSYTNAGIGPFRATAYMYFRASSNSTAHYLLRTASASSYPLTFRVDPRWADTTLSVSINNGAAQTVTLAKDPTLSWQDTPAMTANLAAGLNVIRVKAAGATNTNINSLKFTGANFTGNLITWNMDGNSGTSPRGSSANVSAVNSSTLSLGSGLTTAGTYFSSCWAFCGGQETSLANAVANNRYATFTVTPNGGPVTINSVSVYAWSRVSTGNFTLEASTSGFGSGSGNNLGTWSVYANENAPVAYTFTLTNPIVTSAPVEFRFYVWGVNGSYSQLGFGRQTTTDGVNDLALTGTAGNGTLANTLPGMDSIPGATTRALNTAHAFTVYPYDLETAAGTLTVTAASDNQILVPNGNISITGSGTTSRNVTVTPASNQYGIARITLTVSDGSKSRSAYYDLTVTPTLSGDEQLLSAGQNGGASGLSDPVNGIRGRLAFDGKLGTSWISPPVDGHWVYVNLGGIKRIQRVKITFGSNYGKDFKIQYPDNNPEWYYGTPSWYDITGGTVVGNTSTTYTFNNLSLNQQYLRLFVSARASTGTGVEVKEMEVYGTPPYTTASKINCGQTTGTPPSGWSLDDGYTGWGNADRGSGITWDKSAVPAPVPPDDVYRYDRYGSNTYTVGGLTPGASKTVRLHFAESYFTQAGKRKFDVKINGTLVLDDFDIYATAGARYKAVEQHFTATVDANGKITIQFINVTDNAQVNGLEVN